MGTEAAKVYCSYCGHAVCCKRRINANKSVTVGTVLIVAGVITWLIILLAFIVDSV